jgi:hypothetical protein
MDALSLLALGPNRARIGASKRKQNGSEPTFPANRAAAPRRTAAWKLNARRGLNVFFR